MTWARAVWYHASFSSVAGGDEHGGEVANQQGVELGDFKDLKGDISLDQQLHVWACGGGGGHGGLW